MPGWTKAAGKAAKASFRMVSSDDGTTLEDFTLDAAGGVTARGVLRLGDDQGFLGAKFTTLKLSANDDVKLDIDRTGAVTPGHDLGSSFDARPLLRALMAPGDSALSNPGDVDLDVKVGSIQGLNSETLGAADLKLALRSGAFRDFRLSGRLRVAPRGRPDGAAGGRLGIVDRERRRRAISCASSTSTADAGRRMLVQLYGAGPQMSGIFIVNKFVLRTSPRCQSAPPGRATRAPNNVQFTKLKSGFSVGGGKLAIRDATMWGPAVGGTLDGTLDFTRDKADMSGTFVPAYGLNNIFNQVPIVGPHPRRRPERGAFRGEFPHLRARRASPRCQHQSAVGCRAGVPAQVLRRRSGRPVIRSGGDPIPPSRAAGSRAEDAPDPRSQESLAGRPSGSGSAQLSLSSTCFFLPSESLTTPSLVRSDGASVPRSSADRRR